VFGIDLYFAVPQLATIHDLPVGAFLQGSSHIRALIDLMLIGVAGGLYIVPLFALVQSRSEPTHRSRIIAGNNILNALFMVVSAVLAIVLLKVGLTIPQLLLLVAVLNAAIAIYIYSLLPEFVLQFLVWMLVSTLYRIDRRGLENIPRTGPAIVICNHVTFIDALIVGGCVHRPVRFVMDHNLLEIPLLGPIFKMAKTIPIAPAKEDPQLLERAYAEIDRALAGGDLIGLFPEGGLTRDGEMQAFRPGLNRIVTTRPVPVVPMALSNLWESMWSRRDSALRRMRVPRRFRARIGITAGEVLMPEPNTDVSPGGFDLAATRALVLELRGEAR
jgi:1-acyl-sn-glycerol-3-phosphate acyltransferase